jgi:hypothetical protein
MKRRPAPLRRQPLAPAPVAPHPLLLALALGSGGAAAQQVCPFDGFTFTGTAAYAGSCEVTRGFATSSGAGGLINLGSLGISGDVRNDGRVLNLGSIAVAGKLAGAGRLDNLGRLEVQQGGNVRADNSANRVGAALVGGAWHLLGSVGPVGGAPGPTLSVGSTDITDNRTDIVIQGPGARFSNLKLAQNTGTLTIAGGHAFQADKLRNDGTITVTSRASVKLADSASFVGKRLETGEWRVIEDGASAGGKGAVASLVIGSGDIVHNAAKVLLSGAEARFDQLRRLTENSGVLTIADGHRFTAAELHNTGTLVAADGGTLAIDSSKNIQGASLVGGTWRLEGSGRFELGGNKGVGASFNTNAATVVLSGSEAKFDPFAALRINTGTLSIENSARFTTDKLDNRLGGTLATSSGGTLELAAGGNLRNEGQLLNQGVLEVRGNFDSKGSFDNGGLLRVAGDGLARISQAENLQGTDLKGGRWVVEGEGKLVFGTGAGGIVTNAADITLRGADARFDQLGSLTLNKGQLTIADGRVFTAQNLANTGTLTVRDGASVNIAKSDSLNEGALTEGQWLVIDSRVSSKGAPVQATKLGIGKGFFAIGAGAQLTLGGEGAAVAGLENLTQLIGKLTVTDGANLAISSNGSNFDNAGTLRVGPGSSVVVSKTNDVDGKATLTGGTWEVVAGASESAKLMLGDRDKDIRHNAATVLLSGAGAVFSNLRPLMSNSGSFTVADGHEFSTDHNVNFSNTGTIVVASGAAFGAWRSTLIDDKGQLTGGTWIVDGRPSELTVPSRLAIGDTTGKALDTIRSIGANATVVLRGSNIEFAQLTRGALRQLSGSLSVLDGQHFELLHDSKLERGGGTFTQAGRLAVGAGSSFGWATTVDDRGAAIRNGSLVQQGAGSITQVDGWLVMAGDKGKVDIQEGRLHGNGIVAANSVAIGRDAVLGVGDEQADRTGHLTVAAHELLLAGRLELDLASRTDFDLLDVLGDLDLARSSVAFNFGFALSDYDYSFDLIHYDSLLGTDGLSTAYSGQGIENYNKSFRCDLGACTLRLTLIPDNGGGGGGPIDVPVPASYTLLLAGLALLAATARRRRRALPSS